MEDEEFKFPPSSEYLKRSAERRKWWAQWDSDSDDEEDSLTNESDDSDKTPSTRKRYKREHYRESCWWKFLQRDELSDLMGRDGKLFRNRFTVPYQLFLELLAMAKIWFPQREYDAFGKEVAPIELKLLGTLRMLGKGCSWDLLYELSGVSAEVHRRWTLKFIAKFALEMFPVYVHGPRDNSEMEKVSSLYAASGFPGCIGSIDCVHIRWE